MSSTNNSVFLSNAPATRARCHVSCIYGELNVPVRMFWKASSTLLASKADVSMKERLFSPDMKC
jgi:hypothetical protein